ncbi:uncharacterized protein LOC143252314 [Tachypleus tridentatus]|uniref:uncharacterized protein LOC143252314 n=1 Tax=Tachypleus tridentatus TaxID=6853 RepID=UPI003FD227F8
MEKVFSGSLITHSSHLYLFKTLTMIRWIVLISLCAATLAQYTYDASASAQKEQDPEVIVRIQEQQKRALIARQQQQTRAILEAQKYDENRPRNYHPPAPVHFVKVGNKLEGDYDFGYDTGKGPLGQSFRKEVRLPDGTVKGVYGYVDADGKQRTVKYVAGKAGFVAAGDVGPEDVPRGVAPGPAPKQQPQYAPPEQYAPAPAQQYAPAPAQQYAPPPAQQYAPPPAQQYAPPPAQQYAPPRAPANYRNSQQQQARKPVFVDTSLLNYNIGVSQ